ncbi:hypothetical protein BC938DRAFT_475025 [Jimgerdemannia flammicorona]|uniref:F-box domain-containing protein n=1 Tax=Jimgerdemannia flammicorona TaxID=994334 RepID=A0A433QS63_9FUNG|nr:hypothetical protein BC938DRAFT_475025 [Jimgerdemannia flammicorona]
METLVPHSTAAYPMDTLPRETLNHILSYLPPGDLFQCALVNKVWHAESDYVLKTFGFLSLFDVPQDIKNEIKSSLAKNCLGKSIFWAPDKDYTGDIPVGLPLPPGIVDLLGRPALNPDHTTRWDFRTALSRMTVTCLPTVTLRKFLFPEDPTGQEWNSHPAFILHPLGRRIFLEPYDHKSPSDPDPYRASYIEIRLDPHVSVRPMGYGMRHHSQQLRAPRSWSFLGCESLSDEDGWEVIREHVNDQTIPKQTAGMGVWTVEVPEEKRYRRFRIVRRGQSAAGHMCQWLHCSGWELYGNVYFDRKGSKDDVVA